MLIRARQLFDDVDLEIDHHKHKPNQVAKMLFQKINDLYDSKKITGDQLIILILKKYNLLQIFAGLVNE